MKMKKDPFYIYRFNIWNLLNNLKMHVEKEPLVFSKVVYNI